MTFPSPPFSLRHQRLSTVNARSERSRSLNQRMNSADTSASITPTRRKKSSTISFPDLWGVLVVVVVLPGAEVEAEAFLVVLPGAEAEVLSVAVAFPVASPGAEVEAEVLSVPVAVAVAFPGVEVEVEVALLGVEDLRAIPMTNYCIPNGDESLKKRFDDCSNRMFD